MLNPDINAEPDDVVSKELSRISLNNWTCGANSEPYVAVEIRQPPPSSSDWTIENEPVLSGSSCSETCSSCSGWVSTGVGTVCATTSGITALPIITSSCF